MSNSFEYPLRKDGDMKLSLKCLIILSPDLNLSMFFFKERWERENGQNHSEFRSRKRETQKTSDKKF